MLADLICDLLASGEFAGFGVFVAVLSFFGLGVLLVVVSFGIGFLLFVLLVVGFLWVGGFRRICWLVCCGFR